MANMHETEWEMELENEFEGTMESEFGHPEAGQQLEFEDEFETHETAHEFESGQHEFESNEHHEYEDEFETGEQFIGGLRRRVGGLLKRIPFKQIAKLAAPLVATAI